MPVIATNTAANSAVRYLNINATEQSKSLSKLASGSRITQASDDAAGLAIATRISSDVTTLQQAATNASHGVSILQTADGGASNISDILQRLKALATEAASGTVGDTERSYINEEFSQLIDEIDTIASGTRYNGVSLLDDGDTDNEFDTGTDVIVGSDTTDTITITIDSLTSTDLGVAALDVSTQAGAATALDTITDAIDTVSAARAKIGAQESRFEFTSASIASSVENLSAADSAISDVDIASEEAKLASAQVMVQAAVSAASSANQLTQNLLKLLQ
ncbi:flagellin [Prosthecomicrobium hirschii]|uniref:Flagellin n=1 Tax=Prosthecodimorpha hirschii TaxID=665126 RepID=A0A0P6W8A3_9HYPH|nr:flagellin [Prosthecomicrobium hirschii]KPL53591.1 flagellin [Prosthecomicrobium hirschii]MCW1842692.1 flagellin [Prosthecomicrobium hirschii]TPQ49983.1 flagellin [Prosthecomicrobium hirschii]